MEGRAIDELYILSIQESSKFDGINLRQMAWKEEFAPLLVDVLSLLCRTSNVLTDRYTATR